MFSLDNGFPCAEETAETFWAALHGLVTLTRARRLSAERVADRLALLVDRFVPREDLLGDPHPRRPGERAHPIPQRSVPVPLSDAVTSRAGGESPDDGWTLAHAEWEGEAVTPRSRRATEETSPEAPATASSGGRARTDFDEIYDQPDPRAFFRTLGAWEYQTPHHAQAIFRRMVAAREQAAHAAEPVTVVDLCCSYGINAALLNHDLTMADLYEHYGSAEVAALSTAELVERDRAFYATRRRPDAVRVVGLDAARNAVGYARAVGLLEQGFAENLETAPPSEALLRAVRDACLITVTGGISFLSPRTFQPLLAAVRGPVWVAAFVLRSGSYQSLAEALASFGLVTEVDRNRTFPQRRFTDDQERQYAVEAVTAVGEDPEGRESDGYFHAALHLSRPAPDVTAFPLASLLDHA
ncbi:hypothetical protein SAMN05444320_104454 [Streptoalloteichus hindustanus]|uniref:Methyltransferase domain-containing protein n=1 Tax=Streptoalloteichus hindustanus TaxID=2017 RepID=A0A1M5DH12_STRHI|nr:hypothetical protein SAMN05444320_104454 [Streptoalloteichus hindustanus]